MSSRIVCAIVLSGSVVTSLACGSGSAATATATGRGGGGGRGARGGEGAVPVVTARVVRKDVPITLDAIGNVEAFETVSIRSQVTGIVTEVLFHEGDFVKANDHLFTIDQRPFQAQLEQAQANLARDDAALVEAGPAGRRGRRRRRSGTPARSPSPPTSNRAPAVDRSPGLCRARASARASTSTASATIRARGLVLGGVEFPGEPGLASRQRTCTPPTRSPMRCSAPPGSATYKRIVRARGSTELSRSEVRSCQFVSICKIRALNVQLTVREPVWSGRRHPKNAEILVQLAN